MVAPKINGNGTATAESKSVNWHKNHATQFARSGGRNTYSLRPFDIAGGDPTIHDRVQSELFGKTMQNVLQSLGFATVTPVPGGRDEIELPYVDSWVIHACTRAFADAVRGVPVQILASDAKDAKPVSENDPVAMLFAKPTPGGPNGTWMTWSEMCVADVIHRKLSGETFWFCADVDGKPIAKSGDQQIPLPVQFISVNGADVYDVRDPKNGLIREFWYNGLNSSSSPKYAPESVLHFADYNPYDPQRGLGSAEVALRPASVGFQAERYQEAVLRAGGPGAYLIYKKEQFQKQEERRLQETIDESIRQPDRIGGLQLLTGEVEIVPNPAKPNEMLTKDSQAWQRDIICSIFGVPPPVIGIYDRAIMHNITEAYRQFWINVKSYLDSVCEVLNSKFFPRLKEARFRGYRIAFDYTGIAPLQEDETEKIKLAGDIAAQAVGLSFNDVCRMLKVTADLPPNGEVVKPITDPAGAGSAAGDTGLSGDASEPSKPKALSSRHAPRLLPAERRSYVSRYHARVTARHERRLGVEVDRWLGDYEREQIGKIRHFAETGEPQRNRAVEKDHTSLEEQIDAFLLVQRERWAKLLEEAVADVLDSSYLSAAADIANQLAVVTIPMTDARVLAFLATQKIKLVEGVTSTLADRVRMVLLERLTEPANIAGLQQALLKVLPELTDDLRRVFGTREARAATIARTEVNKATSNARILQMLEAGVKRIEWGSSEDDHVRPSHVELDGQDRAIGEEFKPNLRWPDDDNGPPEEVINCLLPGTAVSGAIVSGLRAEYSGQVVEIKTARGHVLRVTPNHPVLTAHGWIPAHAIRPGHDLISDRAPIDSSMLGNPHNQQRVALVEDVFDAIASKGRRRLRVVSALDLHGDAAELVPEIDVERTDCALAHEAGSSSERSPDLRFVDSDSCGASLHSARAHAKDFGAVALATPPSPRAGALTIDGRLARRRIQVANLRPLRALCLGPAAHSNAMANEHAKQWSSSDAALVGELLQARTVDVALDQVVQVRRFRYCGHVFDLQSRTGWILAQGIVSSNCRCVPLPLIED